jgi:hypothetical protein
MPKITKPQLNKLKKNLPHGAIKKIADEKKVSSMLVSLILNGKQDDKHGIIVMAAEIAEGHKTKMNNSKASQIIKSL